MMEVPAIRIQHAGNMPVNANGRYVLYWMIAQRRLHWHYGLQHAVQLANTLGVGVVIFEALRAGYPWASDRLHRFVLDGMAINQRDCTHPGARLLSYVEPQHGAASGLLEGLAKHACAVVTDAYPAFFLRRMVPKVAERLPCAVEIVDANGIIPLALPDRTYARAYQWRKFLHQQLPSLYASMPDPTPLDHLRVHTPPEIEASILTRWPLANAETLAPSAHLERTIVIDHTVLPVSTEGGSDAALARWHAFQKNDLGRYADGRNHPDDDRSSRLSPYLHFGHISVHQLLADLLTDAAWTHDPSRNTFRGKNSGWWGLPAGTEAFLDQLITWRELGYHHAYRHDDYDAFSSIPQWAKESLDDHIRDIRWPCYSLETLANAQTDDPVWNAAQTQLRTTGRMHNYLRMLWGKKVLSWTPDAYTAYTYLVELNNRYALDGRDPNSYSGILWTFGKFDRAWGPERPIYGKVRYMTSESTQQKLRMRGYLKQFRPSSHHFDDPSSSLFPITTMNVSR